MAQVQARRRRAGTSLRFRLIASDGAASSAPADVAVRFASASAPDVQVAGGAQYETNGDVTLRLLWPGNPGDRAIIQASTDPIRWVNLETNGIGFLRQAAARKRITQAHSFGGIQLRVILLPPGPTNSLSALPAVSESARPHRKAD